MSSLLMDGTRDLDDVARWRRAERSRAGAPTRERAILEVNNAIISNLSRDTLLAAISRALARVVPFDRAALTLHDPATSSLRLLALEGRLPPRGYPVGVSLPRTDSHVGWVFDHQRTLLRRDLAIEREFSTEHRLFEEGIRALCTAPLIVGGKSMGTLTIGSTTPHQFDDEDEAFLGAVANQVALAVSNMRAFEEIAELKARLVSENQYLREELRREHDLDEIVGRSAPMLELLEQIAQVAGSSSTVLVTGETGTGKELIAQAIHERSARRDRPLVKVNCGAISAGLVESELFGHVRGAFTGAFGNRDGRFKLADGGTIFLDEVSELPLEAQTKLLRVLQERELEPVGGSKTIRVDVRVIAATNRDLAAAVREGRFRSDLYYRLNVVPIDVPPLRARPGDVPLLVQRFVPRFARKLGKTSLEVPDDVMAQLTAYAWPGNVRELQNVIERAVVLARGNVLSLSCDFARPFAAATPVERGAPAPSPEPASMTLSESERRNILTALTAKNWLIEGQRGAAKALGIHPNTLRGRMRKLGIARPNAPC
jgi:formate hydrogenlyase transcriptional activator